MWSLTYFPLPSGNSPKPTNTIKHYKEMLQTVKECHPKN